jgi:hypothetical protein
MAVLRHEVWKDAQGVGMCLAGPQGDSFRRVLEPDARLLHAFEAGSWYEAMTIYNRLMDFGPYKADGPDAYEPYPEEWQRRQSSRGET